MSLTNSLGLPYDPHDPPLGLKPVLSEHWSKGRQEEKDIKVFVGWWLWGVDSSWMTSSSLPPLGERELTSLVKKEAFVVFSQTQMALLSVAHNPI